MMSPSLTAKIHEQNSYKASEKFKASGQDMLPYLKGLPLISRTQITLTYWDTSILDVLLSLQQPKQVSKTGRNFLSPYQSD